MEENSDDEESMQANYEFDWTVIDYFCNGMWARQFTLFV